MFQRSGDLPVGVPSNMVQYAALLLMIAQATDLEPDEYVHTISDAHIYLDQLESVQTILARETAPFPSVELTNPTKDIFAIRREDFSLTDYHPAPAIKKIPVGI
jgi:thymidylate synthase